VPAIDLLTGSAEARNHIEKGLPLESLFERWRDDVTTFESNLQGILMYQGEV